MLTRLLIDVFGVCPLSDAAEDAYLCRANRVHKNPPSDSVECSHIHRTGHLGNDCHDNLVEPGARTMMQLCLLVELLAIIALIAGVPIPIAGTVALIAATPTSAISIIRILKSGMTASAAIDIGFLFFAWIMLPCLLVQNATDGVGENVFRFIVAARVFAAASIWRHLSQRRADSAILVTDGKNRVL